MLPPRSSPVDGFASLRWMLFSCPQAVILTRARLLDLWRFSVISKAPLAEPLGHKNSSLYLINLLQMEH